MHGLLTKGIFRNKFVNIFSKTYSDDPDSEMLVADWRETERIVEDLIYTENKISSILEEIIDRNLYEI